MKHARKLTSLLLALVMVFALAVTAFADETGGTTTTPTTGTITVENPVADRTYTAYKIFDVVYDTKDHYSYTIDSSSNEWFETVRTYANDTMHGLTLTQVNGGDTYVVTFVDDTNATNKFSAPDFAATLKTAVSGKIGRPLSGNANSVSVSGLDLGYYFVFSDTGALCNLTTTNPNANIHDKTDMPFEKKVNNADVANVDVGQTVTFTITGKVPDHTGFAKYTYLITDTMSKGLTFNSNSVKVTIGGADATDCTTTVDTANANKFTVLIPVLNRTIGAEIKVTYTATVNKDAIAVVSENKAELTYSNDPTDSESTANMPPEIVKVYTSKIAIEKVEKLAEGATETPKKLEGAKFVLYKEVTTEGSAVATKMYYKWNDTAKKVEWVAEKDQADVKETNKDGEASFDGLANGIYHLVETKAPAGYNQLTEAVPVTVNGGTTETALTVTERVENQAGTLLPSTGGMGTTIFYVLGAVLVVGAGVLLVTKKRMSQSEI